MSTDLFITGTDTGVGKTLVSALLCAALDGVYWKPIQTGACEVMDRRTVMELALLPPERMLPECYVSIRRSHRTWRPSRPARPLISTPSAARRASCRAADCRRRGRGDGAR